MLLTFGVDDIGDVLPSSNSLLMIIELPLSRVPLDVELISSQISAQCCLVGLAAPESKHPSSNT
ncbi:hypothetical protein DSL72_006952 [Monilinia vaccinii-corymbosi]|uniref:Uncharacterized protein n=1 Tax=Monilinia vaccinii-corymbosi TaxID=61207 RepID=A0A8A3PL42_9HELO|nr:hypothetical protein DSL72_006952 [Monilinia vaccinii-corymbosi]